MITDFEIESTRRVGWLSHAGTNSLLFALGPLPFANLPFTIHHSLI